MAQLTFLEWWAVKGPCYSVTLDRAQWSETEIAAMVPWITEHCGGGWFYHSGTLFVFERSGDQTYFAIWLRSEPFDEVH